MSGFTSTSSSIQFLGRDLSGKLHSRRLLLYTPLHKLPSIVTTSSASPQTQSAPYAAASGFDANVVMVLSVLLCALICSLGLRSIIKCSLRCSSLLATGSNNSNENVSRAANTSKGIKRKALKAFTTVNYSPHLRLPGLAAECVICLSEFAMGERVRLLPKCNHGFHLRCIDKWLTSHSSCPTCRQNLLDTCQKIAGCNQPSSSQLPQPPSSSPPPPRETPINLMPLPREDLVHDYRGNSPS